MKSFFYFVVPGKYAIADTEYITQTNRIIDICFNDLAKNTEILNTLNLVSHWSKQADALEGFAFYLSSFAKDEKAIRQEKLLMNPLLRIVIEDDKLYKNIVSYL